MTSVGTSDVLNDGVKVSVWVESNDVLAEGAGVSLSSRPNDSASGSAVVGGAAGVDVGEVSQSDTTGMDVSDCIWVGGAVGV